MAEYRWKRGEDDFAARVDLESIRGVFQKGVVVEPGCKALLIVDGAHVETLGAGEYNEGGIVARLKNFDLTRWATAILVDVGDVELQFTLPSLMTKDPISIDIECSLVIQVDEPLLFFTNVMKGRTTLTRSELQGRFAGEVQNALQEAIGRRTVDDLNTDLKLKQQFELAAEEHLKRTFSRAGFGFVQFRTIAYNYRGFDKIRGMREEFILAATEDEAKLAGRRRLFDVFDRTEMQAIFEETRKLERQIKQQGERSRLLRELNPLTMDEQKSTEEMEKFLLEVKKGKLLRDAELDDYVRTLQEAKEDAVSARKFLLKRIELERELQYEEIRLVGVEELEFKVAEAKAKRRRMEFDIELAEDRVRQTHLREQAVADAQTATDIQKQRIEIYRLHKETQLAIDLKEKRETAKLQLEIDEQRLELDLKRRREEQKLKIDMVTALSNASLEALLTVAEGDQAKQIAELRQLETLKGMSEEQILAWAASKNPALVSALEKKYAGLEKQELERLYFQMSKDKDQFIKMSQEMFNKALDTQKETAIGVAGGSRPTTVVAGGGMGMGPVVVGPGGAMQGQGLFRCTRCEAVLQPDAKYCNQCGKAIAGGGG